MDEAARICARLLVAGAVRRQEIPDLDHPEVRADVELRLSQCGLSLATSAYSDHVGLRLSSEVADATVLDAASNRGLGADACALLTVLWARLALQRRTAEDSRMTPNLQAPLLPEDRREAARLFAPFVRFETLAREFGSQLGGRTRMKSILGQLRRLGFVSYRRLDQIEAGPLLELAIDGEKMVAFIRSRVLSRLLEAPPAGEEPAPPEQVLEDRVMGVLAAAEEPCGIAEIERRSGIPRRRLGKILKVLREDGKIEMIDARGQARYRPATPEEV
jgi:hypothetical protein